MKKPIRSLGRVNPLVFTPMNHASRTNDRTKPPFNKTPSCDKTPFKVNYLRSTVNVVKEKDGSTVHGVFYLHRATQFKVKIVQALILLYFLPRRLMTPAYLYSSLKHYTPSRTLRSSDSIVVRSPCLIRFGSRSFAVAAPTIWNSLPLAIRS